MVWKITREPGIRGLPGPTKRTANLVNAATEEDLVQRNFVAQGHNELWLTDITKHPTREGKAYCCVVLVLYSPEPSAGASTARRVGARQRCPL